MRGVMFVVRVLMVLVVVGLIANCADAPTSPDRTDTAAPPIAFATASNGAGLSITTDKDDYAPGDTVWFTGAGWQAGDTLDIVLTDEPLTHPPHAWSVEVDQTGGFRDSTYVVDVGDLGVTFTLTATGRLTGESLTVVFTDGNIRIQSNKAGVTFTVTATKYVGSGNCTAGAQAPATSTIGSTPSTFTAIPGGGGGPNPPPVESFKFVASAISDQTPSAPFVDWTTTDPVVSNAGNTLCVVGFNGTRSYTANYAADPDLEIVKSAASAFIVGNNASYSIEVKNTGNATASGSGGSKITVTDLLPTGLAFVSSSSLEGWSNCSAVGQSVTCELPPGQDILSGASRSLTLTVSVASAACPSIVNSATVGGGNEPAANVDAKNTGSSGSVNVGGCNAGPTAEAGGPYSGNEGSAISLSGASASGTASPLAYKWTYAPISGVDAGATCSFTPDDVSLNPSITCTDDGTFEATLTVTDDDQLSQSDKATVTVSNANPVAVAGGPYSGDEGSNISLSGSGTDAGANDAIASYHWTVDFITGIDAGGTCNLSDPDIATPTVTCTDDGSFKVALTVTDDDAGSSTAQEATLTVANVKPVANAVGPYSGNEGSAIGLSGSGTDVGTNDAIASYHWTVDATGIDAGGICTISNANIANPTVACTDDGSFKVGLTVTDDDGATSLVDEAALTVANVNPVADAGGPYSGDEGSAIALTGSGTDAGANDAIASYHWTVDATGIDGGGVCTLSNANVASPTVTCTDDGSFKVTLTVTDDDGGASTAAEATLIVANVAPTITSLTLPLSPVPVNTPVSLSATFTDPGSNDTHSASINWEAGTNGGTVTEASGSVSGSYTYLAAGIYTVVLTVSDDDAGSDTETFMYVVVYDPSAGFVTGGGWINSLSGMYLPDPSLFGKANFGFVSKYQKGANVPTGNTEFQFHAASLNFSSTSYEWLVVNGTSKAIYKGSGTVNGAGNYGFLLSIVDNGNSGDKFRMKIWDRNTDVTIYDNQVGAGDNAEATTQIAGGNIVVQTGKK